MLIRKQFLIINAKWRDWETKFRNNDKIKYINTKEHHEEYDINDYYILCMKLQDYKTYYNYPTNIFNNTPIIIELLNNKTLFYKYMMQKFINHIPEVYYYNNGTDTYKTHLSHISKNTKMILKPNLGCNGGGIKIIKSLVMLDDNDMQNASVTQYIDHTEHYVGQFLVMNGQIIHKVYFKANNDTNHIKVGEIHHYTTQNVLDFDDSVYDNVFKHLNYSGFAHSDFINVNNTLIMFEINPWIGSCLVRNAKCFDIFIDKLSEYMSNSTSLPNINNNIERQVGVQYNPINTDLKLTICSRCGKTHAS
uniref:ATP-grasp domain-containing protein n=1 Tax=viral metagenome TaxID=1070528 RepID=A0A6C0E0T9_9ZZZZ